MNLLVPLAALLGIEFDSITERVRNAVILNAVIVAFAAVGAFFLVAAGFFALSDVLGVIYAALIFAAGFLVLALAVYLGSLIGKGRHKREVAEKRRSSETSAFVTTAAITALPVLLRSPLLRTLGIPAAALAAFLLVRGGSDKTEQ
ncbi:hypothetical protein [Devosia psychrophila]|jgi:uncharacterized membrane protein YciS (DUF1049 family)|uniref:Holin-X, holin superfamily III n=1 Tax=Devosia psychrophila TaxID=728005 RepID=A0A1I1IPZ5_9HYPH|nr:hypothetical protein [Devosia psychrophila]SFC35823.1 hypothetical protein SAMN04488059_104104 [Devosia psychrophila]